MKRITKSFWMTIWISLISLPLLAQNVTIKGVVSDKGSKEPMVGVSVLVNGTNNGVITDSEGRFSLSVPSAEGVALKFSFIGYKTVMLPLKNTAYLKVSLEEDANVMNEVVVVGYGIQKKESIVGAISSIDNSSLVTVPVSNLTQSLAGKLAGVQIVQPSGEVGRDEANIYVRGIGTYNNSSPLILVDGIVRESFAQIDPNEIQSINILKDASATAVFGVKGANGVVIITTRRGAEGKSKVSFSAQYALTQPMRIPDPLPSYQAAALKNISQFAQGKIDDYTALQLTNYRTGASPYAFPDTHWVDEIMKKFSSLQQYNVNISGGTPFVKYFVSGGYLGQDGFYKHDPYTNFSRYNFRSNLDFDFTKRLKVSFNLGARIEKRQFPGESRDNSWNIYRGAFATGGRNNPVYNPDGSLAGPASSAYNLLGVIGQQGIFKETKSVVEMGLNVRYDLDFLLKGLAVRGQLAFDNTGSNSKYWGRSYATYYYSVARDPSTDSDKEVYTRQGEDTPLQYGWAGSWFDQKVYGEVALEYNGMFGKHSVTGLLLGNRNLRLISNYNGYADQGVVGRATYDYDKRYFAELNAGYNGSENFRNGKRYSLFPSFAFGWLATNEKFFSTSPLSAVLTHLKLRGSIGWVGNDKAGDISSSGYQSKRFIYLQQYYNGGGATFGSGDSWFNGIYQGNIANNDVTWETGRKINVGLESSFFNGFLSLNVDVFSEKRKNILTDISSILPEYVGKSFMPANIGVVTNKGVELEFTHRNKIGKDFNYTVKGNYSYTRNKVIRKADPAGMLPYQREEGYSIGTPLLYKCIGVFQSYEDIYNSPSQMGLPGNTEVKPGDSKYQDFNGDGVIDINDAYRQGYSTIPEIQYGVTLSMDYKEIDFSVLFQGSAHSQFAKNWEIMWPFSNADNVYSRHWRYWTPETNGSEEFIRFYGNYLNNEPSGGTNSLTMGSGDYVRLKNMELGYTFPKSWTSKLSMSSVRIYLSSNNLFLWAKEPSLDPDNRDNRGGRMPQTRAFNFGINVNF
jgi:TonB-linked SusC/RagA family outer membrane protein